MTEQQTTSPDIVGSAIREQITDRLGYLLARHLIRTSGGSTETPERRHARSDKHGMHPAPHILQHQDR